MVSHALFVVYLSYAGLGFSFVLMP